MAANGFLQVQACLGPDDTTHFRAQGDFLQEQASKFKQTSSQQAFQRMLFELYGMDQPLPGKLNLKALDEFDDDDDNDDFPDALMQEQNKAFVQLNASDFASPSAGTSNSASNDAQRERCSGVAAKPRCENILDKLGQMQGELFDALNVATKNLQKHDTECSIEIGIINGDIQASKDIIAQYTEQFDKA